LFQLFDDYIFLVRLKITTSLRCVVFSLPKVGRGGGFAALGFDFTEHSCIVVVVDDDGLCVCNRVLYVVSGYNMAKLLSFVILLSHGEALRLFPSQELRYSFLN
jgi:hypothetical protein